jgi:hypothetical protein
MKYSPPADKNRAALGGRSRLDPEKELAKDLCRFKTLMEKQALKSDEA